MKQMVYVVLDNGEVVGVYDHYTDAEDVATETATITPVLVGKTDDCRVGCETPDEVIEAMEHELSAPPSYPDSDSYDEDEDEDEDDWDDEDEDDEDDEEDMDSIIYDVDGRPGICADDARLLIRCVAKVMMEKYPDLPDFILHKLIQNEVLNISKKYGIEMVDCSEDEGE